MPATMSAGWPLQPSLGVFETVGRKVVSPKLYLVLSDHAPTIVQAAEAWSLKSLGSGAVLAMRAMFCYRRSDGDSGGRG